MNKPFRRSAKWLFYVGGRIKRLINRYNKEIITIQFRQVPPNRSAIRQPYIYNTVGVTVRFFRIDERGDGYCCENFYLFVIEYIKEKFGI